MKIENSRCLILNADYTVLGIINWQKALVWSMQLDHKQKPRVEIVDFYKDDFIQGVNKKFPIPAVVRTFKYFRIHDSRVNFCRINLFIRDDYSCQYCGIRKNKNELTYDHVVPKSVWKSSMGSPTNWTNIVTACINCNRKKGDRTPKQANMPLKNIPIAPKKSQKYLPILGHLSKIRMDIPEEWSIYLSET
jgi:hypothetical protein